MKKITPLTFVISIVTLLIFSCSNPLDKPYKSGSIEEDIIKLKESLTEEELEMLGGYIALSTMRDDKMFGKTYGDLLKEAKKLKEELRLQEEEEKKLAEKAKIEEAERIKRLGKALTVSLFDKGFKKGDFQSYINYKFVFENKAKKDIKAFTGLITFNDLFDKEISSLNLTYDDGVKANSTKNWNAQTDFNQFKDKDILLRSKDVEDLKVKWIPKKIIYKDGSTLE